MVIKKLFRHNYIQVRHGLKRIVPPIYDNKDE